ncbi:MAG: DUF1501 domain-containing protein [Pirellulales bacterium]|nr:DUF1501 domain-containing protein [Pirellulales bacterium]
MHGSIDPRRWSRRELLATSACGFGQMALASLTVRAAAVTGEASRTVHFPARAKRCIFLFMQGGPSHVDSFDYKPRLLADDGQSIDFDDARKRANTGQGVSAQRIMKPQWPFAQHGQTGRWVSELFPALTSVVDDLCFVHSLHTEGVAHGPATLFLHSGATNFIRPSLGSWLLYGLGTENENLPGFVSIAPSAGNGGPRNYGAAFLPARYQGTPIGRAGAPAQAIANIARDDLDRTAQRRQLDLLQAFNQAQRDAAGGESEFDAVVESYELAWRMQMHAPGLFDLSGESQTTLAAYGADDKATADFARKCILARRLVEAGVRHVQVTYGDNTANPAWDQHSNIAKHADHARAVDRPVAALVADLKQRGLLDDTLVWWGGEFGRTPYAQANGTGRDHNPLGFTMWLAGGGVQPGLAYGATDEFGHQAVEHKVHMHDLHATLLHLMGLDHERLTYRYAGRDFRLTDVHGRVVDELFA